jgi:hypothetical protein
VIEDGQRFDREIKLEREGPADVLEAGLGIIDDGIGRGSHGPKHSLTGVPRLS